MGWGSRVFGGRGGGCVIGKISRGNSAYAPVGSLYLCERLHMVDGGDGVGNEPGEAKHRGYNYDQG